VLRRTTTGWVQEAYVKASNTRQSANYGSSVALSADGSTLVVGAVNEYSGATGINGDQYAPVNGQMGAAYVYTRAGSTWTQQAYLKASSNAGPSNFGIAVALSASGDTLAVGARSESSASTGINGDETNRSAPRAGAVYVFQRSAGTWTQQAYVKASDARQDAYFGECIALSSDGDTLAAGASFEEAIGDSTDLSGEAYVFTRAAGTWKQGALLRASNPRAAALFGSSVALSSDGHKLAVGSPGESSSSKGINGVQDDGAAANAGAAYTFVWSGTAWTQAAYVKASNTRADIRFGTSLAISADGSTQAFGGVGEQSASIGIDGLMNDSSLTGAGAVYVFR
jgi:hypothetical protein